MRQIISPLFDKQTDVAAVGARPALVTDGVDISKWRSGSFTPPFAMALFGGDQAISLSSPAGGAAGVEYWALVNAVWTLLGVFSQGAAVKVPGPLQYGEEVYHSGVGTRLAIAAAKDVGAPTYSFVPLETWGLT